MLSRTRRMTVAIRCAVVGGLVASLLAIPASTAEADLVKLKNGGEVRGTIEYSDEAGDDAVAVVTLSGTRVLLAREEIQFATRRPHVVEVYETRARRTPDTVQAQWELAEWCRKQGALLKDERERHLRRIIELDPEHERAHYGLRHTKRDGKWMTYDEARRAQGYIKHKGKWVTPQELELIQKTEQELKAEQQWYTKVRLWKGWLTGRHQRRRQKGRARLLEIADPHAVSALVQFFADEESLPLRRMYVGILSRIPGPKPVKPLVNRSLYDENYELRYDALNAIGTDQYEAAMNLYAAELRDDSNTVVRRAARALERVGDERVVPQLTAALVTTHRYKVRVPANKGMSFSTSGSFGSGGSVLPPNIELLLRTGQLPHGVIVHNPAANQFQRTKVVTVNYDHKNREVLSALQKLTGANYGYDERSWRLWWTAKKNGLTTPNVPATN